MLCLVHRRTTLEDAAAFAPEVSRLCLVQGRIQRGLGGLQPLYNPDFFIKYVFISLKSLLISSVSPKFSLFSSLFVFILEPPLVWLVPAVVTPPAFYHAHVVHFCPTLHQMLGGQILCRIFLAWSRLRRGERRQPGRHQTDRKHALNYHSTVVVGNSKS
jgi:hypothetical protein